jgi:hypothetical protein
MKNLFKKFVLAIVMCLSFVACDLLFKTPRTDNEPTYGSSMLVAYTMNATAWQVDSICQADTLPNIDTWLKSQFTDYETNEIVVKRLYYKDYGDTEIVYIITGSTEPFIVTRRITE